MSRYFQSIGADPEVFLVDKKGVPFSAEGLFGGTKKEPKPMGGLPKGFCIQEDNVSAEYNIPPAKNAVEFWSFINSGFKYIKTIAAKHDLEPILCADLDFPYEMVSTPHALTLGCDPDFNAWRKGAKNPRPRPPQLMRTAAGHVHISWIDVKPEEQLKIIKAMDILAGLPSILVTPPNRRRELYGKAGAYRPKSYGVEYRTLDNFWLKSAALCSYIFNAGFIAVGWIKTQNNDLFWNQVDEHGSLIQQAINEHNRDLALDLMRFYSVQPIEE